MVIVFVVALALSVIDARNGGRARAVIEVAAFIIVALYVLSVWMGGR
jgi:threonine/homoserine/homoserine lactone efflux protein